MKLIQKYSQQTGLKIKKQFLAEHFYPLSDEKRYITIQAGSSMTGKNYPYYAEFINMILPFLNSNNINIYQLGGPEDLAIQGCIHLQGKTTIHQANYILARSMLHIGNDSWMCHRAGELNIPIIELFGPTSVANHSPYRYHPSSIFIESHRRGLKTSFFPQELIQTINFIKPEQVAYSFFKILGVQVNPNMESILFGKIYNNKTFEWVPDGNMEVNFLPGTSFMTRCDYLSDFTQDNFQYVVNALSNRPLNLIINKPVLDPTIIVKFKSNIPLITIIINDDSITTQYVKTLKSLGIPVKCVTTLDDSDTIINLRMKFFEVAPIEKIYLNTRNNFFTQAVEYNNYPIDNTVSFFNDNKVMFKSNKFIFSQGKAYLSKAHFKSDKAIGNLSSNIGEVIDEPDFWTDLDYFYFIKLCQPVA